MPGLAIHTTMQNQSRKAGGVARTPRAVGAGPDPEALVRPLVRALKAYVPGEQPKIARLVKLNTNENPYPPSPRVLRAVKAAVDGRLRLYPSPTAEPLREKLAALHGCTVEHVLVGNGSDEVLTLAVRAFVEPARGKGPGKSSERVQFLSPSYSLYPVLAEIHGAIPHPVPLRPDYGLPSLAELAKGRRWRFDAGLTLVTTPNAPSGRGYGRAELDALCGAMKGVVVLDEAYVDFADENALDLALRHPHVLVARTFSKSYSLCFQRVGYCVGHPSLIGALHKIRDSYNVNGLGQVAAAATLDDLPYYRRNFARVRASRDRLARDLAALGFEVLPSQTNFVLTRPPGPPAREWLQRLRERRFLVRWFSAPGLDAFLRISIGTEAEMKALVRAVRAILAEEGR